MAEVEEPGFHDEGAGDDLLIAGVTAYDDRVDALDMIAAEWSSNRSYEDRVANLRAGGGPILDPSHVRLQAAAGDTTVFSDNLRDQFHGGAGRDWFFAQLDGQRSDALPDRDTSELVDAIETAAFASWQNPFNHLDVDFNGLVTLNDLLMLVNNLRSHGIRALSPPSQTLTPPPFLDVNGVGLVGMSDLLKIVASLREAFSNPGDGEAEPR